MKLKTVPKHIEEYMCAFQLRMLQERKQMADRLNMTGKDFQFLAETFKKIYSAGLAEEAAGIVWAEKLLVEEIKSRCPDFNEAIWNQAVGFDWLRGQVLIPEQDQHDEDQ